MSNPICEKCSRKYRIGYNIDDKIWAKLPKKWDNHSSLCLECFLEELEKTAPRQKLSLFDFKFLALLGDFNNDYCGFGGTIIGNDYGKNRRIYLGD